MYFSSFPITKYSLDDGATVLYVRNILLRVTLSEELKNNLSIYDEYDVKDYETPEIVSFNLYGTTEFHWLVLHVNDVLDPRFEWVLSTKALNDYVSSKYTNPADTHHYIDTNGFIVNSTASGATSVSNYEYEEELNESRRRIKVIKPQFLASIVDEFEKKIKI
jgi:hypothetical protein